MPSEIQFSPTQGRKLSRYAVSRCIDKFMSPIGPGYTLLKGPRHSCYYFVYLKIDTRKQALYFYKQVWSDWDAYRTTLSMMLLDYMKRLQEENRRRRKKK